ncbi:MAG: NUDIX hydrolase [Acidobacteriota bacterium]|nr:NUDIX hydrolase [Acidobacteriota bacterium]
MTIKTLSSREVYRNRWMRVREDAILRPDGSQGIYGVVEKPEAAMIIPVQDGRVYMVQQYRYTAGARYWEFPQGTWETRPEASAEEIARGELREETGLAAGRLMLLARIHIAYGFLAQGMHVFVATELTQHRAQPEQEEGDLVCASFSWDEFHQMASDGRIADAQTLAGYALLREKHPELAG